MVSKVRFYFILSLNTTKTLYRCTANRRNLDDCPHAVGRTHQFTKLLMEKLQSHVLWQEYGIIDDILVGSIINHFYNNNSLCIQAIYSIFP